MKKIKKLFTVLMIFTVLLGLTACGSANSNEASDTQAAEAQNTAEENAAATAPDKASAENTSAEDTSDYSDILVAISPLPAPRRVLLKK